MGDKRLDLKTGFLCNNNCLFCVQAHNKFKGNRSTEDLKKDLEESADRCKGVVFTGGEVTIRKDLFELVSYAKSLGYELIQIQSNHRMLSNMAFAKKLVLAGANEFSPAVHGSNAKIHDSLTLAPGSFEQTIQAIRNLKRLGQKILVNSVVVKSNYEHVPETAKLLVDLGVDQFQFAFVHPIGNAMKNYDEIVPKMSLAAPFIKKGLQIGIDAGLKVMAEAMPYCLMKDYEEYVSENFIPSTEVKTGSNFDRNYTFTRANEDKLKFKQCKECLYDSICEGPWKEYSTKFGNEEFKPIKEKSKVNYNVFNNLQELEIPIHNYQGIIPFQDFIEVNSGIKKAFKMIISPPENYQIIKQFLNNEGIITKKSNFKYVFSEYGDSGERVPLTVEGKGGVTLYASKSEEILNELIEADLSFNDEKIGKIFGYPQCCIDAYNNRVNKDYILESYKSTKEKFDWKLNNFIQMPNYYLIPHYPCSYDCKESIKLATRILEEIKKEEPAFAEQIERYLKRPVLYSNNSAMIFEGYVEGNSVIYRNFYTNATSYCCPIVFNINMFKISNKLKVSDDKIEFFNGENLVGIYNKKDRFDGILIDFGCEDDT